ncbi:DUF2291 domain-containing protein [Pedobacter nyackensis]|uniref:Predicted lipoprotein n=1 Tax=Pedobacter nyackensis TaxID=475255 RepID=A0A1W2CPV1_9SPHI|nr:DUF2291 domain-containing protein [Pedobacter nyackensis]SMC87243.1 Predicted lipoprotein [Pedobacter nyackensis]
MKKFLKYLLALIAFLFIGYHSVYFKKLTEVSARTSTEKINISQYTRTFWNKKLLPSLNKALSLNELIALLKTDPEKAFSTYGKALGIGDLKYFMVKGVGKVMKVNENEVALLSTATTENLVVNIATEYVYGNAVRDASGLINTNDFDNTSDFNEISAGINQIIRDEVLPDFKKRIASGDRIEFVGAIELNKKFLNLSDIEITPVQLKILK